MTYLARRMLLLIPTLLGILSVNFLLVHMAPGGPLEHVIAKMRAQTSSEQEASIKTPKAHAGFSSEQEFIEKWRQDHGFYAPLWKRFFIMLSKYIMFDFGTSYFKNQSVASLILERIPVSLSIGLWAMLLIYMIGLPLGIAKAVFHRRTFDSVSSFFVILGYALPNFLVALLLLILFAGGSFWSLFPLKGIVSSEWESLFFIEKIKDYAWHMVLPTVAQAFGGFAPLTWLTKNAFLEEMKKTYVISAKAQGFGTANILFKKILRNAMLIFIADLPIKLAGLFLTSSLLIEMLFSLDGLGCLGYEAVVSRDYPVMMGTLYIYTLLSLSLHILSDFVYTWLDPRIHFEKTSR